MGRWWITEPVEGMGLLAGGDKWDVAGDYSLQAAAHGTNTTCHHRQCIRNQLSASKSTYNGFLPCPHCINKTPRNRKRIRGCKRSAVGPNSIPTTEKRQHQEAYAQHSHLAMDSLLSGFGKLMEALHVPGIPLCNHIGFSAEFDAEREKWLEMSSRGSVRACRLTSS